MCDQAAKAGALGRSWSDIPRDDSGRAFQDQGVAAGAATGRLPDHERPVGKSWGGHQDALAALGERQDASQRPWKSPWTPSPTSASRHLRRTAGRLAPARRRRGGWSAGRSWTCQRAVGGAQALRPAAGLADFALFLVTRPRNVLESHPTDRRGRTAPGRPGGPQPPGDQRGE